MAEILPGMECDSVRQGNGKAFFAREIWRRHSPALPGLRSASNEVRFFSRILGDIGRGSLFRRNVLANPRTAVFRSRQRTCRPEKIKRRDRHYWLFLFEKRMQGIEIGRIRDRKNDQRKGNSMRIACDRTRSVDESASARRNMHDGNPQMGRIAWKPNQVIQVSEFSSLHAQTLEMAAANHQDISGSS